MKPVISPAFEKQDAWKAHLLDVFSALEIPPGPLADNISASVAAYCRHFHPRGLKREDLVLLIARAFCSVGDRSVAEHALASLPHHRRHIGRWLDILSELHHFPKLLPYFSMGIIRPADWAGAQQDRMWILDFDRLVLSDAERHEMMLYRTVRVMIENMYGFWDATRGEGVLGLKGLHRLQVDADTGKRRSLTAPDELLGYIGDLLQQQSDERQWKLVPALLNLDL